MIHTRDQLVELIGDRDVELVYDDRRYNLAIETRPLCSQNCPAGINVKGYVNLIANKRYDEALELIRESNPFPGICGRVCTHPCEANCGRNEIDDPISIKALKRFVSDYEISRKPAEIEKSPQTFNEKIAVIGAGPAGLSASVDLTRLGYQVTVFEAMNKPGGMMMWGIPEFRLPRDVLKREIDLIKSIGVILKTGTRIHDPSTLLNSGFDAVILATGAWKGIELRIPGEKLDGVIDCLEFLRSVYMTKTTKLTGHVVVIGGGDSAVDAARTALRLGAENVTIAYRRTEKEMPANSIEIREAKEEGIDIRILSVSKRIIGSNSGQVVGIELLNAELGDEDASGRRRPIPISGSEYVLPCDMVIPSISAMPEIPESLKSIIPYTPWNTIDASPDSRLNIEGLFAIGDAVRGPSTIVDAIGDSHICAATVHSYLRGNDSGFSASQKRNAGAVVNPATIPPFPRSPTPTLPPGVRSGCFDEVEGVYTELVARNEASRCNTCGPCSECHTCLPSCDSKQAVAIIDSQEFLLKIPCELSRPLHDETIQEWQLESRSEKKGQNQKSITLTSLTPKVSPELCFACGRCEDACAYRAIRLGLKADGKAYSYIDHDVCRSCARCVLVCPSGAISLDMYSDTRLLKRITASIEANHGIAVFTCHWSPHEGSAQPLDTIELMCSVSITPGLIIQAFASGARGVLISHCSSFQEHYLGIEYDVETVYESTKELLLATGISEARIHIADTSSLKSEVDSFISFLDTSGHHAFKSLEFDNIPGRVGREIEQLQALSEQSLTSISKPTSQPDSQRIAQPISQPVSQLRLKGMALKSAGMPHTLDILKNIKKLAELLNLDINPDTVEPSIITPTDIPLGDQPNLPVLILNSIRNMNIHSPQKVIGIHTSCSLNDATYTDPIRSIIGLISGLHVIDLEPMGCGATDWRYPDSFSREKAMSVYRQAEQLGIDTILPTSFDCLTHLKACNRQGAWRHSSVEVTDIYSLLLHLLRGGGAHE